MKDNIKRIHLILNDLCINQNLEINIVVQQLLLK